MHHKVFIPYGHQYIDDEDVQAVVNILKGDWLTQGPKVYEFEEALANYCGARYAVVVSSGTAALHLATLVAGVKSGDRILTSPFGFVATSNSTIFCGGIPSFVDINPETYNLSIENLRLFLNTHPVKAILPVHYGGLPCQIKEIYELAKIHHCIIIEDACHALGAQYEGKKVGSCFYSDMTVFSFHPVKSITTGEGGAILTNSESLYKKLMQLRNHGISKLPNDKGWYYEAQDLGYNYRLSDMHAALGLSQLKKIDFFIKKRRELVDIYYSELGSDKNIILPVCDKDIKLKSSWHLFPIQLKLKNVDSLKPKIFNELKIKGIGVQVHYIPIHLHPYYQQTFGFKKGDFPVAEAVYSRILSLPLYVGLKKEQIQFIVKTLRQILKYY